MKINVFILGLKVQSLSLIVDSIESLMDTNLSVGQMRMAEKLEKIIGTFITKTNIF